MLPLKKREMNLQELGKMLKKPAEGSADKGLHHSLVALIKGCIPDCKPEDFLPEPEPEEGCKRLHTFLGLWFPATNNKVDCERKAFAEACKRLQVAEVKSIVNNIRAYRQWLLKTGERQDCPFWRN